MYPHASAAAFFWLIPPSPLLGHRRALTLPVPRGVIGLNWKGTNRDPSLRVDGAGEAVFADKRRMRRTSAVSGVMHSASVELGYLFYFFTTWAYARSWL